jgi:hypothetical protein
MEEYSVHLTEAQIIMLADMCESKLDDSEEDRVYLEIVKRLDSALD